MSTTRFLLTPNFDDTFVLVFYDSVMGEPGEIELQRWVDDVNVGLTGVKLHGVVIESKAHLVPVAKRASIFSLCGAMLNGDPSKTLKVTPCKECLGLAKEIGL